MCNRREEAIELTRRLPNPAGEIEVRQLFELEEFGPRKAVDRFVQVAAKIPPARVGCAEVGPIRPIRETVAANPKRGKG